MTKSKKGKVVQMLTPENYIRKKARTLPIFECLVASEWEESGLPTVVIARTHVNGNITACTYMVDLKCLGVKDSSYLFNVSPTQYREFKDLIQENIDLTPVDYALAHNIVLAGVEYAEELGFKPYKDYESVTKFMLEEDTEEIELMEIECGRNGKPFYIKGPYEDTVKARQIIAHLEKVVGPGNYHFVLNADDPFSENNNTYDSDEEEDLFEEDEFEHMTFEEKKQLFLTLMAKAEGLDKEEESELIRLDNSMVVDLVDENQYNQYYDQYFEELDLEVTEDVIPDELLGINFGEQVVPVEWKNQFHELFFLCSENPKRAEEELKLFKKQTKNIPGVYLLELMLLNNEKSPEYEKRLQEYALIYPDYAMIQLLWASWQVVEHRDVPNIPGYPFKAETFFDDREFIHAIEFMYFSILNSDAAGIEMDINKIEAFIDVIYDLNLPAEIEKMLTTTNVLQKFSYLIKHVMEGMP